MSKWADLYTLHDDTLHIVPMDVAQIPPRDRVSEHVFGHIPFTTCWCKPHVRFSDCGEHVVVSHRDHEKGSLTADREILQ